MGVLWRDDHLIVATMGGGPQVHLSINMFFHPRYASPYPRLKTTDFPILRPTHALPS